MAFFAIDHFGHFDQKCRKTVFGHFDHFGQKFLLIFASSYYYFQYYNDMCDDTILKKW
jgi:hypothetical protein